MLLPFVLVLLQDSFVKGDLILLQSMEAPKLLDSIRRFISGMDIEEVFVL